MTSGKRVVMLGATGAVGSIVAASLAPNEALARLTLLGRRPLVGIEKSAHSELQVDQKEINIFEPAGYRMILNNHNVAICTLGVGEPSKVSKEDFVKVDKQAVLDFARECKRAGVEHFLLLSSVGVSSSSRSFYLRTKGELQDELCALKFARLSFFEPSMILTPKNRYGLSQALTLALWPIISIALVGPLKKFKGVKVASLGQAIAANVFTQKEGVEHLQWADFQRLSGAVQALAGCLT